jgi:type VI protein secretion system component VasF
VSIQSALAQSTTAQAAAKLDGRKAAKARRSPNRQRLIARVAVWTVWLGAAAVIIPRVVV